METGKSSSSLSFGSKKVVSGTVKLDGSGIKLSPVVKGDLQKCLLHMYCFYFKLIKSNKLVS